MNNTATRLVISFNTPSALLRRALLADATLTSVAGIVLVLAARPLGVFLSLPATMLEIAGLIFIPFGAYDGRPSSSRTPVTDACFGTPSPPARLCGYPPAGWSAGK
jgi:hypothetical protein